MLATAETSGEYAIEVAPYHPIPAKATAQKRIKLGKNDKAKASTNVSANGKVYIRYWAKILES